MIEAPPADPLLQRAPSPDVTYYPSPTVLQFILSVAAPAMRARLLILMGSRGEGKTFGGIYACLGLADRLRRLERNVLPVRVAVVRDTWANLARTTIVSFKEARRLGLDIVFSDQDHQADYDNLVHWDFFGLDRPDDADKLQGYTCGVLWLEEVAPAAGLATGVPAEALGIGITSLRQSGVPKRVLVTMNPPDEDHWILKVEEFLNEQGLADFLVHRFEIPAGEKSRHFEQLANEAKTLAEQVGWTEAAEEFEAYRRRNRLALESIGRSDLVARLAEGRVGGLQLGEAVVSMFDRQLHVYHEDGKPAPLPVYPNREIIRAWDAGLTPSTVYFQVLPSGDINILATRMSIGEGMAQHILHQLVPFQAQTGLLPPRGVTGDGFGRPARGGYQFRDIGDPAAGKGSNQANSEATVARVIETMLGTSFEPGPVAWSARREALHWAFSQGGRTRGRPKLVQIDATDPGNRDYLVKALAGRFHYKVDPASGRIDESIEVAKRVSGVWSGPPDCLGYGFSVLMPVEEMLRRHVARATPRVRPPKTWIGA